MEASNQIKVMVVDDQADVRFLVRLVLEDAGPEFSVVAEADGLDSLLESIDAADPDVVVMDARMPRIDGFEAAPRILERRPSQAIVLLTGLHDDDVRERAAAVGIAEVVSKDDFEALPGVLRRLRSPVRE
jgi:CheY-like chemotaxis protein